MENDHNDEFTPEINQLVYEIFVEAFAEFIAEQSDDDSIINN